MAAHVVNRCFGGSFVPGRRACELNRMCRNVLSVNWDPSTLQADVKEVLPMDLRTQVESPSCTVDQAVAAVRDWSGPPSSIPQVAFSLGAELCVSGIPCVDYSPMGARQGVLGKTFILVIAWAFVIRINLPLYAIVENVPAFPLELVIRLVGDL